METPKNIIALFDDDRQPRSPSEEETDGQVHILTDPTLRHTPRYALPDYQQTSSIVYDIEKDVYLMALRTIIEPFSRQPETDDIRVWLLAHAKQLENQGIPYSDIVKATREASLQYWAIINGTTSAELTDIV